MIQKTKDILQHYASKISIWLKNGAGKDKKTCNTRQKSRKFLPPENYIDTKDKLESLVKRLKSKNEISVDIEGDSLYSYYSKICLIQISTRNENFIVDPLSIKDVSMLSSVFSDEKIQKVLHGSHYDIHMLYTCSGIEIRNLFDTQIAACFLGEQKTGLASLVEKNFNVHLQKKYQKNNWGIRPIPEEMLEYAVSDTMYLLPLADILKKDLLEKNRLSWVEEECRVLTNSARKPRQEKTPHIKGFGKIPETKYPVLEAVLKVRDEIAKEKDIPPFKVIDKQAIYRIITEKHINLEKLKQITHSHRYIQNKHLPFLLEKIKEAEHHRYKPHADPKKRRYHPDFSQKSENLHIWRASKATELNIAQHLVLSHHQILSLAGMEIKTLQDIQNIELLKNWQKQKFSHELYEVLHSKKNQR
jgi:ribonuclease D